VRSYLTPYYLHKNKGLANPSALEISNETNRQRAVDMLLNYKRTGENEEIDNVILGLAKSVEKTRSIRNAFAHNLNESGHGSNSKNDLETMQKNKKTVDDAVEALEKFRALDKDKHNKVQRLFELRMRKAQKVSAENARLLIPVDGSLDAMLEEYDSYGNPVHKSLVKTSKKSYSAYAIPDKLWRTIQKQGSLLKTGYSVGKYIGVHYAQDDEEEQKLQIIFVAGLNVNEKAADQIPETDAKQPAEPLMWKWLSLVFPFIAGTGVKNIFWYDCGKREMIPLSAPDFKVGVDEEKYMSELSSVLDSMPEYQPVDITEQLKMKKRIETNTEDEMPE